MVGLGPSKKSLKRHPLKFLEHVCVDVFLTSHRLLSTAELRRQHRAPQRSSTIPLWKECLFLAPSCRGSLCLLMRLPAICSPPRSKSLLTFTFVFFYRRQIAFCENVNQGSFWIVLLNAVLSKISSAKAAEEFF